jgi:hypothetical protein
MEIVTVRTQDNSEYSVPALLLEDWNDGRALIEFAAGNRRIVALDALAPGTAADRQEFEDARARWIN